VQFDAPGEQDQRGFSLPLPYSFSGKLVSIVWAVQATADGGGAHAELEMAPQGRAVVAGSL
jgi:hypothetical protein